MANPMRPGDFGSGPTTPPAQTPIEMKPFTRSDWDGMAGAEPFEDGVEPLVAYPDDSNTMVLADAAGLCIEFYSGPDYRTVARCNLVLGPDELSAPAVRRAALLGIVAVLPNPLTIEGLTTLGLMCEMEG